MRGVSSALLCTAAIGGLLLMSPVVPALARDPSQIYARVEPLANSYFIDFRARPSKYIGHTYVVFGRFDSAGQIADAHYAGLVPGQNALEGLFVPIHASVGQYRDDARLIPTAIYRRRLSAIEYQRVISAVSRMKATEHQWHAIFQNCNSFGVEIASVLGLARPPSLLPPSVWVGMLQRLNEP